MTKVKTASAKRIAELNDRLRWSASGKVATGFPKRSTPNQNSPMNRGLGQVLVSAGIAARGEAFKMKVLAAVAAMTPKDFKKGNDPYGERDFNSFSVEGRLCHFKIDDFAKCDLRAPSDDPSDAARTERLTTLMLADEY